MQLSNIDARVGWAVGAFIVDLSMLHEGVRDAAERFWDVMDVACEERSLPRAFDTEFEYDGPLPFETFLPTWEDIDLRIFYCGIAHSLEIEWTSKEGRPIFEAYRDGLAREMRRRKLPLITDGYDLEL